MQQQDNIEQSGSNAPFIKQSVSIPQKGGVDMSQKVGGTTASVPNPDWASGIDASHYQQTIDWKLVSEAGYAFAFIKATESNDKVDALFSANWTGAKGAGVLRGAYHFFQADVDPETQAEHFIKTILSMNDEGELPPALDLEPGDPKKAGALAERVKAWLDRVEAALGKRPIIYSNRQILDGLISTDGSTPPWTNDYPLWIAYYPLSEMPETNPRLPHSWRNWMFWQYTDQGFLDGIRGSVNLNYFNGSKADLEAFARARGGKQRLNFALNDRPEGPDRLNYETYADAFAQLLSGRYTQTPLTVGIYASWGMGKSFLLGKIREKLEAVKSADNPLDFAFIPFNAWVYSGSENLWAGLITTLYDGIEKHYESKGARLVQKYRRNESLKQLWRTFVKSLSLVLVFGIPAALYSYFLYQEEIQESWASVLQVILLIFGGSPILSKLPDLVKGLKSLVDSVVLLRSKELANFPRARTSRTRSVSWRIFNRNCATSAT